MLTLKHFIAAAAIGLILGGFYAGLQNNSVFAYLAFPVAALLGMLAERLLAGKVLEQAAEAVTARISTISAAREPSSPREQGVVKWFNYSKGFGFITRDSGEDIFVHFRSIRGDGDGKRGLREGQRVEFDIVEGDKGLQAEDVALQGSE